ncbi:type IV pilus modification PilV family protein [Pirellulaceae bacterium SH501]
MTTNIRSNVRRALTVLEVLFAIGIILVGLVGIAAMVPFAGRQAADSYRIAHGIASGSNALAAFKSDQFLLPSSDRPWQLVDDFYRKTSPNIPHSGWVFATSTPWQLTAPFGATNQTFYPSFARLYDGNRARQASLYRFQMDSVLNANELAGNPRAQVALAQNRALGVGFCIDPLFYAEQIGVPGIGSGEQKITRGEFGNFRRNRFPFYDEAFPVSLDPFEFPRSAEFRTPRLMRISYRDPSLAVSGAMVPGPLQPIWLDKSWARGDAAKLISTIESRDLVSEKSEDGLATIRQFNATGATFESIVKAAESGSLLSWIATVTPSDSTPIVNPLGIETPTSTSLPGMEFFPESYDVTIVVFAKRNVNELATVEFRDRAYPQFVANGEVPQSERLCRVAELSADSASSGTFEVLLNGFTSPTELPDSPRNVSPKLKIGDWIMLSRYVYDDPLAVNFPIREKHQWYRIVGVAGTETFPRRIRVAGAPWDWSIHELDAIKRANRTNASIVVPPIVDPTVVPTSATLLSDVITVYQRTLSTGN